jgi:hypothetical protein
MAGLFDPSSPQQQQERWREQSSQGVAEALQAAKEAAVAAGGVGRGGGLMNGKGKGER